MQPILTSSQIRLADAYTIKNEPIASIDLMERACKAFVNRFEQIYFGEGIIKVFCGTGNNGGDGLGISRLLLEAGHAVESYVLGDEKKGSADFKINLERLTELSSVTHISSDTKFPQIGEDEVIIDALFGSGLSRPLEGLYADLVQYINECGATVFSVDIASGLSSDSFDRKHTIIKPTFTIAFQVPKHIFFQPQSAAFVGRWFVEDIGLNQAFIHQLKTNSSFTQGSDVAPMLPVRKKFSHKGDAGRLLIVAGSLGKIGAAVLSTRAAMRSGVGLLTTHVPGVGMAVLQSSVPEAMCQIDADPNEVTEISTDFNPEVVAVGPGMGVSEKTTQALKDLLVKSQKKKIILDADAINTLSKDPNLIKLLPQDAILTPHPGEFQRLAGAWNNDFEKLNLLRQLCIKTKTNIVLKGAYSAVCSPDGHIYYNPTGNPGMATAGSGDVLTGVIAAFFAQGLTSLQALRLGVYVHGFAGDLARERLGTISLMASDIIEYLPLAIHKLSKQVAGVPP